MLGRPTNDAQLTKDAGGRQQGAAAELLELNRDLQGARAIRLLAGTRVDIANCGHRFVQRR
jgi:hypothetical protein